MYLEDRLALRLPENPDYTMADPESVRMNYMVNDNIVEVMLVCPGGGAERFQATLNREALIVNVIVQLR
ncbi:hypothetical protein CONLIGDRAFT_630159 [Coniochaeta ligniaria NRRL 30616]|uniref:Uncharacterized protein n=1 Tax=Coniochaeta ligniaria NRRL 30616 TaxID=1408157 RepID=A0A1J7JSX9_9PEZI|nr:hypothetical protein CONLIGDRAFT_630159 [Coniochaeta ligniaria NRRL 30616]